MSDADRTYELSVTEAGRAPAEAVALGIDLRSGPRYPTGLAALGADRRLRLLRVARTDDEIVAAVEELRPDVVAIDAPLGLPEGRCCADVGCACARYGIVRAIDRRCAALGYRPFPALLPSMVGVTLRGMALAERLAPLGVLEVYPGMAQDILGIPRKRAGLDLLARGLRRAGVRGLPRARRATHDELDAATCALVGVLHLEGATETWDVPGAPPCVYPRAPAARVNGTVAQRLQFRHGDTGAGR